MMMMEEEVRMESGVVVRMVVPVVEWMVLVVWTLVIAHLHHLHHFHRLCRHHPKQSPPLPVRPLHQLITAFQQSSPNVHQEVKVAEHERLQQHLNGRRLQ